MIKHGYCPTCGAYTPVASYVEGLAQRAERPDFRTDTEIAQELHEAIAAGAFELASLHLTVLNGVVTLQGEVRTKEDKQRLADLAFALPEVLDVHNLLTIGPSGVPSPS